jgi:enoyl-CoA hydratase/carnithine racemase
MKLLEIRPDGVLTWIGISSVNNTINSALLGEFEEVLDRCAESAGSRVLILHGAGRKFFSPGLDLHEVSRFSRTDMAMFMEAFSRLYLRIFTYPKPILAMLNGDALAGGFLIASCCDLRYGHSGIKVGLTSLSRSVVMPFGSLKILEFLVGTEEAEKITARGTSLSVPQAFHLGWLDGIFELEGLEEAVQRKAQGLASQTVDFLRQPRAKERKRIVEEIRCAEEKQLAVFLEHWFSEEAQQEIERMVNVLREGG